MSHSDSDDKDPEPTISEIVAEIGAEADWSNVPNDLSSIMGHENEIIIQLRRENERLRNVIRLIHSFLGQVIMEQRS